MNEDKLKKLLTDIVTELSYTVMPGYHTDQVFKSIKDKIEKVDLSEEGSDPSTVARDARGNDDLSSAGEQEEG